MADEDLTTADKPKGSNPKPVPKPGSLKPAGSGSSSKKNQKDYKSLTGRQKAAIFLISLGPEVSAEIMKHLREDEVETLTFEIARQEKVNPDFKDAVLEEFQELMNAQHFITTGGIDYARELLEKSLVLKRLSILSTDLPHPSRFVHSILSAVQTLHICSTLFSRNIRRQLL